MEKNTLVLAPYNTEAMKLLLSVLVLKFNIKIFAIMFVKKLYKESYQTLDLCFKENPEMADLIVSTYNKFYAMVLTKYN